MDDDILSNLEAQVAGDTASAERPGAGVEAAEMREMQQGGGMRDALSCLPPGIAVRVATVAMRYGIKEGDDPFWAVVEVMQNSFACAKASGAAAAVTEAAAREVGDGVGKIQGQILAGAIKAGHSVKGDLAAVIKIGGDAILASINEAATAGSDKVKEGSKDLIEKLDKAVESKKKEGVSEFALAAAEAATAAAGAASQRVISETKVKLRYSLLTMSAIFLVYAGLGGVVGYEFLSLTHRIAPSPIVMLHGKPLCGEIVLDGQDQDVCRIR